MRAPFTTVTLGAAISHDAVRAVSVQNGAIVWTSEAARSDESMPALDAALRECLAGAPKRRWGRTRIVVAVGPHSAQMRLLTELPPLEDPRALARVVEEGTSRFFLRNGVPLVTTGIRIAAPGEAWAAAFEQPLVDIIGTVCRDLRLAVSSIVPSVAVLGAALLQDAGSVELGAGSGDWGVGSSGLGVGAENEAYLVWRDGPVVAQLTIRDNRLVAVRRASCGRHGVATEDGAGIPPRVAAPLAALGEHGWRYAAAFGAAILPRDETVVLRPSRIASSAGRTSRWRLALAAGVCTTAIAVALAAPGLTASRASQRAERQLAGMATTRRSIAENSRAIGEVTAELNEISAFGERRRSATLFLEALTIALPPEAAIVALRVDSAGGNLMALAPRAAAVLSALDSITAVAASEIVGPVTREIIGARELERVTLRFRWNNLSVKAARRGS